MATTRPYSSKDKKALHNLVRQLHDTLQPYDRDLADADQVIDHYFSGLLSKVEETDGAIFVAEENGEMVGYVCMFGTVEPAELDEKPDRYSFIAELFVSPGFRDSGIGRLLVDNAESFARRLGTYKMELWVYARNKSAIRLYEALGYEARIVVMSKRM